MKNLPFDFAQPLTVRVPKELLIKYHCYEKIDSVANDPETSEFRRRARIYQALWRDHLDMSIGTQKMRDGARRPLGSRLQAASNITASGNFLNEEVNQAVQYRVTHKEPHQTLRLDRLYTDLLSSMPLCFNLFGSLHGRLGALKQAVQLWWPSSKGDVAELRFEWSPGRCLKGRFLENRSAFDAAIILDLGSGKKGVIGIETKYHEDCRAEKKPSHALKTLQ